MNQIRHLSTHLDHKKKALFLSFKEEKEYGGGGHTNNIGMPLPHPITQNYLVVIINLKIIQVFFKSRVQRFSSQQNIFEQDVKFKSTSKIKMSFSTYLLLLL